MSMHIWAILTQIHKNYEQHLRSSVQQLQVILSILSYKLFQILLHLFNLLIAREFWSLSNLHGKLWCKTRTLYSWSSRSILWSVCLKSEVYGASRSYRCLLVWFILFKNLFWRKQVIFIMGNMSQNLVITI